MAYNNKTGFSEDVQAILKHRSPLPENSDSVSKEKDKSDIFIRISNPIYDNGSSFNLIQLAFLRYGSVSFCKRHFK